MKYKILYRNGIFMKRSKFKIISMLIPLFLGYTSLSLNLCEVDQKELNQYNEIQSMKNKTNKKSKYLAYSIVPSIFILLAVMPEYDNHSNDRKHKVKPNTWDEVAESYKIAADDNDKESPEYHERMGDCYRCLMYEDLKILRMLKLKNDYSIIKEKDLSINYKKAVEFYKKSSDLYSERVNKAKDKTNYEYQINLAKSAEVSAKSSECWCEASELVHNQYLLDGHCCMGYDHALKKCINCGSYYYLPKYWINVKGKKKSYDAYADAKYYESLAKYKNDKESWENAAKAWLKVESDKDLKDSFSKKSWDAYRGYAEAKRQECLLKCGKSSVENVQKSWLMTSKLDLEAGDTAIYKAFAAEAKQRALDLHR